MEIKRDAYLSALIDRKEKGLIKVITGIRRCGKSYFLNTIFYNYLISEVLPKITLFGLFLILRMTLKLKVYGIYLLTNQRQG